MNLFFGVIALLLFIKYRKDINCAVDKYIIFCISCIILSDITRIIGTNDFYLILSDILRLGSMVVLYEALIKTTLEDPYNVLSGKLSNDQRTLKHLEDMYYQLFYNINVGVVVIKPILNGEDFVIVNINNTALNMDNLNVDEVINHELTKVWPGVKDYGILDVFKRVNKTGVAESHPTSLYSDDRIKVWRDSYIYKLASGLLVSVYTDETEKKIAEGITKDNEKRYRMVADFTNDWEYWLDPEQNYLYLSPAVEKVTGYKPQDFIDDPHLFDNLIYPNDDELIRAHFDSCKTDCELSVIDFRIKTKDGTIKWISHSCRPLYHNGEFLGRRANNRDITIRKGLELELFEAKSLMDSLFAAMSTPVFYKDMNLRYIGVNKAYFEFFGMDSDYVKGKTAYDIYSKEWADIYNRMDQELLKTGKSQVFDTRIAGKNNTIDDVSLHKTIFRDINGDIAGIVGVVFVITERKQLEEELIRSEKRFRALAENQYDVFWAIDENFKFDYISPSCERVTGHSVKEVMETVDPSIFYTPESWKIMMEYFVSILNKIPKESEGIVLEVNQYKVNGDIFPSEITAVPIIIDGKFKGIQGITRDITERVEARKALEKSKLKFETLLDNLNVAVYRTTPEPDGRFLECNNAAVKIFGANSKEHLLNISVKDFWRYPEKRSNFNVKDSLKNKELNLKRLDGSDLIGSVSVVAVKDSKGELKYHDIVLEDITLTKNLEGQLRHAIKMEAVGRLASAVSHDFNNTLAVLLGYSDLLKSSLEKDTIAYERASKIHTSVQNAKSLIKKLLRFSRKDKLDVKPLDITKFLQIFYSTVKDFLRENIKLKFKVTSSSIYSEADASQLNQIFMNLIVNAQDAMPDGGSLSIECDVINLDESYVIKRPNVISGDYVLIAISDTGHGIPKNVIDKIFDPFFTTKTAAKGTGLGLSTVYGIVKQHKGDVWVYSEEGKGTTFKVYLPVTNKRFVPKKLPVDSNTEVIVNGDETILLVEDDVTMLRMVTDVLSTSGYYVLPYEFSIKCLEECRKIQDPPHLLITDIVMPDLGGIDLHKALLDIFPDLKVIFMSGYTKDIVSETRLIDANTAFVQKPFSNRDLKLMIRKVLSFEDNNN